MGWFSRKLGIDSLKVRMEHLETLEHFTLADVVEKLKPSFLILAADDQRLINSAIEVPPNKIGIIALGNHTIIRDNILRATKVKTTVITEPIQ